MFRELGPPAGGGAWRSGLRVKGLDQKKCTEKMFDWQIS